MDGLTAAAVERQKIVSILHTSPPPGGRFCGQTARDPDPNPSLHPCLSLFLTQPFTRVQPTNARAFVVSGGGIYLVDGDRLTSAVAWRCAVVIY